MPYDIFQNAPSGGVSAVRKRSGSTLICRDQHHDSFITDGIKAFLVPTHRTDEKLLSSDCSDSHSLPVEDGCITPVASQPDEGAAYHEYSRNSLSDMRNADSDLCRCNALPCVCPPLHQHLHGGWGAYNESDGLQRSPVGSGATASATFDSFRGAFPSINRTIKLTTKWPYPSALKYFEAQADSKEAGSLLNAASVGHEQGREPILNLSWKWTPFKVWLLVSVLSVFTYGTALLLCASMTWFNTWVHSDVMIIADSDILIVTTVSAVFLVSTSLLGIAGVFMNLRPLLAIYTFLLWPNLMVILSVAYTAYKRLTLNFERKLNFAWNHLYTLQGKRTVQDSFGCCGFYNTVYEAAPTKRCYARAPVPGCRNALYDFEYRNLTIVWKVAFLLAGLHIVNVIVSLLCSNHVTKSFGKGLMPPKYRLNAEDLKAEAQRGLGAGVK